MSHSNTSLTRAKTGETLTSPHPPPPDHEAGDDNSASTLIESPVQPGGSKLVQHDFPDGGGSGGAEAYRRKPS
jgi:hypothetical protein